jgi:hypothetical protein
MYIFGIVNLHAVSRRPVPVILAPVQITRAVVLEFLLEGQGVELAAQCELVVDLFLTNVKVLDVEEALYIDDQQRVQYSKNNRYAVLTHVADCVLQLLHQLLLATGLLIQAEIKGDQFSPVD